MQKFKSDHEIISSYKPLSTDDKLYLQMTFFRFDSNIIIKVS